MRRFSKIKQYPVADTMHPWTWLNKWGLDIETGSGLLGIERSHSFYRWHPNSRGERREPTKQIQVACALYDKIWQEAGCPYSTKQIN